MRLIPRRLLERRLARVLGIERARAAEMLAAVRERLSPASYRIRAATFLAATSAPARLLPSRARERPVRSLVGRLLERPDDVLFYLGELPAAPSGSCRGLADA
jgi:hypothetical protein